MQHDASAVSYHRNDSWRNHVASFIHATQCRHLHLCNVHMCCIHMCDIHIRDIHICDTTHLHTHTIAMIRDAVMSPHSYMQHNVDAFMYAITICATFIYATQCRCIYIPSQGFVTSFICNLFNFCDKMHSHTHTIAFMHDVASLVYATRCRLIQI